jgi:hypothetical protein
VRTFRYLNTTVIRQTTHRSAAHAITDISTHPKHGNEFIGFCVHGKKELYKTPNVLAEFAKLKATTLDRIPSRGI